MCLQDLRINRRLSVRTVTITLVGDVPSAPLDLSRAHTATLRSAAGTPLLVTAPANDATREVPRDKEVGTTDSTAKVYQREVAGAWFGLPLYVVGPDDGDVYLDLHEYDADTMHAIYGPITGG